MISQLRVENISKDFEMGDNTVHALSDVSFEIKKGELVVVLGPSGSGKSTMLNILGGIETPTKGHIYFEGELIDDSNRDALIEFRRRHVGFVFQFYNLLPGLTALENIELAGELSEDPISGRELIEKVGLGDRAEHFPSKMSGGQQQRVAIARALAKNPDILLCDEPTGALDSKTGDLVLQLLGEFNKDYGKTVIIITHNEAIASMADRVFYFKDGHLERIEGAEPK